MRQAITIVFVCLAVVAFSQQTKTDTTTAAKPDSLKNKYLPTGIRFGVDLIAILKSNIQKDFNGWEANADVDFYRYYLAVDYGKWGRNYTTPTEIYSNNGNYWRAGVDVNFLLKDVERNMFFLGARYGRSNFSEQLAITNQDKVWGSLSKVYTNQNVTSHWLELTTGLRVKIWKMIWMGYTGRLKFGLANKGDTAMIPHDVPGYGRTDKTMTWGFNYQIFIRLPFRPMPPLPLDKKAK